MTCVYPPLLMAITLPGIRLAHRRGEALAMTASRCGSICPWTPPAQGRCSEEAKKMMVQTGVRAWLDPGN